MDGATGLPSLVEQDDIGISYRTKCQRQFDERGREKKHNFFFNFNVSSPEHTNRNTARNRDAPTYEKVFLVFFEFSLNKEMLLNAGQSVTFFGPLSVSTS